MSEEEKEVLEAEIVDAATEPKRKHLVLGDDDERDQSLREEILREDMQYSGLFFGIDRLQVKLPDGEAAQRDVLRHPGAVAVVALTSDGHICLVRQYRAALDRVTVEIPAGKIDAGEDPLEAAKRELLEETGMKAEKIAFLGTVALAPGVSDEIIHLYMATELDFVGADPDTDEFLHVDIVPLEELVDAVLDGRIEDAKTVIGALLCDAFSRRLNLTA